MYNYQDDAENNDEFFSPESPVGDTRFGFKQTLSDFGKRIFQRLDYLPPTLPPEILARPTVWQRLAQSDPDCISEKAVPCGEPPTVIDMLKYRQSLREN